MYGAHSHEAPGRIRHAMPHPARGGLRPAMVGPEELRARVEAESARHFRYLDGFALVRIGPLDSLRGHEALREAIETETRRTDTVCELPDGSYVVLAVRGGEKDAEAIAHRIETVAVEIAALQGEPDVEFIAGVAAAQDRRLDADELWEGVCGAYREAHELGAEVVFTQWDA